MGTTYGTGDGSTTFNVPNLVDKFIEGAATAGTVKAAGLPNITGQFLDRMFGTYGGSIEVISGVFAPLGTGAVGSGTCSVKTANYGVTFDASRASSIYGNSSTVQPPALTMRYAIYTGNVGKYCWLRQS